LGEARALTKTDKEIHFFVADYPELPEHFRECIGGYLLGAIELADGGKATITRSGQPTDWEWTISRK
jgi:hypothetical protein